MQQLIEYLPVLIPIVLIQLVLMAVALVSVIRSKRYRFGTKALWIPVVALVQIIGPILYFVIGREEG